MVLFSSSGSRGHAHTRTHTRTGIARRESKTKCSSRATMRSERTREFFEQRVRWRSLALLGYTFADYVSSPLFSAVPENSSDVIFLGVPVSSTFADVWLSSAWRRLL